MADATDSKSVVRKGVWVRVPPRAPVTRGTPALSARLLYMTRTGGIGLRQAMSRLMRRFVSMAATPSSAADEFVDLYDRTLDEVYSYVLSRVRARAVAEDLTQEVYLAGASRLSGGDRVDLPWLIAVARHKVVDHWRAVQRDDHKVEMAQWAVGNGVVDGPIAVDRGRAADVLECLNPTYRIALVLRHVDGLTVSEVASHLGRSIAATEQILTRARVAFRHAYQQGIR
jgi:RNA polymerase sigma-70 factor, ECF subfamily